MLKAAICCFFRKFIFANFLIRFDFVVFYHYSESLSVVKVNCSISELKDLIDSIFFPFDFEFKKVILLLLNFLLSTFFYEDGKILF